MHASPVVSIQAWIARGSAYETDKLAGISHFLEHALFKGTKRRKVGDIALEIESRGGEINAFTSFEETAYYTTLASRYFEEGLDVIADAIMSPAFDEHEMLREREVILEEIKRAHDSPYKTVSANLWKACFGGTPFGRPVLGFEETVRKIDHRTLREYFEKNYHAGSTSLFVVGDVEPKKVAAIAEKKLAKMRRGKRTELPKKLRLTKEGPARVVAAGRDIKECHVQLAVRAPEITHPDVPAIDLMCSALAQGEGSRLYQRLVKEKHLALEAHMGLVATGRCGLATISIVAPPETLEAALRESMEVLEEAASHGLLDSEVERVKSSLEAEVVDGKETVEGYARRLGYYYIQFGDPEYEKTYLDQVLGVTSDRAAEIVGEVFAKKPVLSVVHPAENPVDKKALVSAISRKVRHRPTVRDHRLPPEKTARGPLVFVTKEVTTLPVVSVRILFLGGTREEPKEKAGLTHLFQRMWTGGTSSYSSLQIVQTLESLGASLYGFAGKNTFGLSVEFLSKHWPVMKPLLTEILLAPTFPEHEFETEKKLLLREIHSEKDAPSQLCQINFLSALYGDHPYGRSSIGTKESVSGLTTRDLRDYFKAGVHKKRMVVSTVGNFERGRWISELESVLTRIPDSGKAAPSAIPVSPRNGLKIAVEKRSPLFQSHILIGFLGASFTDPERYALKLLSSALAGQGGRLFLELRDRQSLAYTVSPLNNDGPDRGLFGVYIGCSPEKWQRSVYGIRVELEKILAQPMGARELDRAKRFWIGRFELDLQRFASQAMLYGLDEIYGQGYRHSLEVPELIESITAKEIQTAAQKFLRPESATLSIVHNEALSEDAVRQAWLTGSAGMPEAVPVGPLSSGRRLLAKER